MRIGDLATNFTLKDQAGVDVELRTLVTQGPVVLFFYPAAMSTGCTKETCHFRDLASDFDALGVQRLGISMDTVAKQQEFWSANRLDYRLLSDPHGAVARAYGVKRPLDLLKVKRATFVIDENRRILNIIHNELNMMAHADEALATLSSRSS